MKRDSYIDERQLASQFNAGEVVQLIAVDRDGTLPYYGRITAVHENIGFLDVETDFGNHRYSPLEIAQVDVKEKDYLVDTGYSSWEKDQAKDRQKAKEVAEDFRRKFLGVSRQAERLKKQGFSEMKAYDSLFKKLSSTYSDYEIKQAIINVYLNKRDPIMNKESLYWKEKGRHYCPSKGERAEGEFHCPKCKKALEKATYKKYTKLYVCPDCLWMIAPEDLVDPSKKTEEKDDFDSLEEQDEDFFEPNDPRLSDEDGEDSVEKESRLMRQAVREASRKYFDKDTESDQLLNELGKKRKHE